MARRIGSNLAMTLTLSLTAWGSAAAQQEAAVPGFGTEPATAPSATSRESATPERGAQRERSAERGERGDRGRREGRRRGGRRPDGEGRRDGPRRAEDAGRNTGADASRRVPASQSASAAGLAGGGDDAARAEALRNWARELIRRYDKNGNMMLEADERAELRGEPAKADLDGDGVITLDELVRHLSPKPAGGASGPTPAAAARAAETSATAASDNRGDRSTRSRDRPADRASDRPRTAGADRKSYRFTSAKERLPAGLPSWFASRDTNGDGQVSMHEYSRTWSDRVAAEFQRYDRNNDGVITPDEALGGN